MTKTGVAKDVPSSSRLDDVSEALKRLESRVSALDTEIQKVRGEGKSWPKRIGLILGFLGGLIAIPKAAQEAWSTIHAEPNTGVRWGQPIGIKYDLQEKTLIFTFNLTATNEGAKTDHVNSASVELNSEQQQQPIFVSVGDIKLSSTTIPFALSPSQSKDVEVSVAVSKSLSPVALKAPGPWNLDFSFMLDSQKLPLTHRYCIPAVDSVKVAEGNGIRALNPQCDRP